MAEKIADPTPDELEAFTVLTLRYLDGGCQANEIARMKALLAAAKSYRAQFVQVCRLHGELHEACALQRSATLPAGEIVSEERRLAVQAATANHAAALPASAVADESGTADCSVSGDECTETPGQEPAAETLVRPVSAEDTIHPESNPPQS